MGHSGGIEGVRSRVAAVRTVSQELDRKVQISDVDIHGHSTPITRSASNSRLVSEFLWGIGVGLLLSSYGPQKRPLDDISEPAPSQFRSLLIIAEEI